MELDAAVGASRNACYGPPEGRLQPLCVEAAISTTSDLHPFEVTP